ncbi:hypothetical protein ACWZQY_024120 [Priestia megaterium]
MELESHLEVIKEKIINKDVKYEDTAALKENVLHTIAIMENCLKMIQSFEGKGQQPISDEFGVHLNKLTKSIDKQNKILGIYYNNEKDGQNKAIKKDSSPKVNDQLYVRFSALSYNSQSKMINVEGATNLPDGTEVNVFLKRKGTGETFAYENYKKVNRGKFTLKQTVGKDYGAVSLEEGTYFLEVKIDITNDSEVPINTHLLELLGGYNKVKKEYHNNKKVIVSKSNIYKDDEAFELKFISNVKKFDTPNSQPPVKEKALEEPAQVQQTPEKSKEEKLKEIQESPQLQDLMEEYNTTAECIYYLEEKMYSEYETMCSDYKEE